MMMMMMITTAEMAVMCLLYKEERIWEMSSRVVSLIVKPRS